MTLQWERCLYPSLTIDYILTWVFMVVEEIIDHNYRHGERIEQSKLRVIIGFLLWSPKQIKPVERQ